VSRVVHHHAPVPGEAQPWRPVGRRQGARTPKQGGGGSGFVNVQNRLFAPLQSLDPNSILQGGYDWLSKTDGGMTYHPGLDLNTPGGCDSDLGKLVVAPLAGAVRAAIPWDHATPGEGNHIWLELFDSCLPGPSWFHIDHLQDIDVAVGQSVTPGQPIGACGKSGGWSCAHGHSEWLTGPPRDGFYQWPYGWSRGQVEAAYWNPYTWWNAASALVYAEGATPPPEEVVMAMSDFELTNYVLAQLYEWARVPFNPDSGIAKCWVAAMRAGHYPGRPRTEERRYGEPNAGVWAEFDLGVLIWKPDGTMSWTG
jgi:murein DD-endopeptidase MepM/ murein hydrolase activator NlpD